MDAYFHPYAATMSELVEDRLAATGAAVIIDMYSYPRYPSAFEDPTRPRPPLCIGTDDFHTPEWLTAQALAAFAGLHESAVNAPYAGCYVPLSRYRTDARVSAVMIELRRDQYLNTDHTTRTGTDIELRIHTRLTAFDVVAGPWAPAVSGFAVTVVVYFVDTATGRPRYLPIAEPHEWAPAIFSAIDARQGYFLGAVDPDTGEHRDGQLAYRLYLDPARRAIRAPRQMVACPHYRLHSDDDGPEIRIATTA